MTGKTKIEWANFSWNPVTGCTQISPGCDHCYALTFAERFRGVRAHPYEQGFDLKLWPERLHLPLHWKKPRKIFVNSMSDWCHERIPDSFVLEMFRTMLTANWHTYQLLTKRTPRMVRLVPLLTDCIAEVTGSRVWPDHLWLGVTVESAAQRGRIAQLRKVPAAVRFISYEPALGPLTGVDLSGIHWLICGGESGPDARPMNEEWVRMIRDQCLAQDVAFFYKQKTVGGKKVSLPELDGSVWNHFPAGSV